VSTCQSFLLLPLPLAQPPPDVCVRPKVPSPRAGVGPTLVSRPSHFCGASLVVSGCGHFLQLLFSGFLAFFVFQMTQNPKSLPPLSNPPFSPSALRGPPAIALTLSPLAIGTRQQFCLSDFFFPKYGVIGGCFFRELLDSLAKPSSF